MNNTQKETANLLNHRSKLIGKRNSYYTPKESEVLIKKVTKKLNKC